MLIIIVVEAYYCPRSLEFCWTTLHVEDANMCGLASQLI